MCYYDYPELDPLRRVKINAMTTAVIIPDASGKFERLYKEEGDDLTFICSAKTITSKHLVEATSRGYFAPDYFKPF
jgi:hypothetical protein